MPDNKFNILVIDDDPEILSAFKLIAEDIESCKILPAVDFKRASKFVEENLIDLVIVDIVLPETDGYEICQILKSYPNTSKSYYIIMSCDKNSVLDRIKAYKVGAHDFISKPFELKEVEVIIKSKIEYQKQTKNSEDKQDFIISQGKFTLNDHLKKVNMGDTEISLPNKEYDLLKFLLINSERYIYVNEIIQNVWPEKNDVTNENARQLIFKLRNKIEPDPQNPVHLINLKKGLYIFFASEKRF